MESIQRMLFLTLLVCNLGCVVLSYKYFNRNNGSPGYLLVAPSNFLSDTNNKVCLSRFGSATLGSATASIELLSLSANSVEKSFRHSHKFITRARKTFPDGHGGCVDLPVPKTLYRRAVLHLRIRFDSLPNYRVNTRKAIRIQHEANINIIQTDKSIYRGGETVKFRILQLKPDLTPQYAPIYRVYLEAPSDIFGGPVKIAQWFNSSSQMGQIQREYKLDKYARKGDWRIVIDSRNPAIASTSKTFHVVEYDLPKFYLHVDYQRNILPTFKQLLWTVCARYMYEEATKGTLHINIKTDAYQSRNIYFTTMMTDSGGCYNYSLRTQMLGFDEDVDNKPKLVIADISFQEADTNTWKNTTVISRIQNKIVNVEFVNEKDNYYKPGLPRKIKVRVNDWDGKPVSGARVQFCTNVNDEIDNLINKSETFLTQNQNKLVHLSFINDCDSSVTDSKGQAIFVFTIPDDVNLEFIYLNAIVIKHPFRDFEIKSERPNFLVASLKLYSWGNKTNVNMEIGNPFKDSVDANGEQKYIFPIFVKFKPDDLMRQITLHYLVVTRSGMISTWGTSTQCVYPIYDVENIEIIFGPLLERNDCPKDRFSENEVYKMMLSMKVSYMMCPYSHLIIYFTRPNGEIVVANKQFGTKECFPNKLTQKWVPSTVSPKSEARLHLESSGPALCMLRVKNVALNHVAYNYSVHKDVLNKIDEFMESRNNKTHLESMSNICFTDANPKMKDESTRLHYWNAMKLFLSTGLEVITDTLPTIWKCPKPEVQNNEKPAEFSLASYHKPAKERYFFPETWLWDVRLMDATGILDMQVNVPDDITNWESEAFCMTRSGIAATVPDQNGILKVFQPFFIEISAPSTIKRGEQIQMYYKIYNYMDQSIPVLFDMDVTPTAAATIISQERTINRITCIPKKQSILIHFTVKAHQLRSINITVMAQTKITMQKMCSTVNLPITQDIRDKVIKEIQVEAEGEPVENHRSALLCIPESSNKTDISWEFDRQNIVENSENWFISLVGDITGPMALNVEKLVSTPMGCGEQNMALLAYNLIVLEYSVAKKRISSNTKEAAINNLLLGYQRQMNYRHSDTGAFSAFGRSDEDGSTWLTAFCLKYLSIMQQKWNIGQDAEVAEMASKWLLDRQMENGCFSNEGQVFHREMKGGLQHETSSIALTAYVIMSILDAGINNLKPSVVQNTAYCLAALKHDKLPVNSTENNLVYTFALATLAQLKIEKYLKTQRNSSETDFGTTEKVENQFSIKMLAGGSANAVAILKKIARRNGEFIWWDAESLSVSIETTAYAILSLLMVRGEENIMYAVNAAKWLSIHRNLNGGFISTQDTLVTIEALCQLRQAMPDIPPSMNVIVEGPGRARHFTVSPSERHKLHIVTMKSIDGSGPFPTKLKIKAHGKGCLLIQATQKYNKRILDVQKDSGFNLYVKSTTDGTFNCRDNNTWCMCAAMLEVCISWNDAIGANFPEMAILEVHMPTGYYPDRTLLYGLIGEENILLRRIEESENGDVFHMYLSAPSQSASFRPSQCFDLYLIGMKSDTKPVLVKVYDYYHAEIATSTSYKIPDECPSNERIVQHTEPTITEETLPNNIQNLTDQQWHVVDSDQDLDVPDTIEGVKPAYELPPNNFNYNHTLVENAVWRPPFVNWSLIDSEMDLDYPTVDEENEEVWDLI